MGCLSWCTVWNCPGSTSPEKGCSHCGICGDAADSEEDAPECQNWCSEWTCNQPEYCGGCAPCMPNPPPPPLLPNILNHNPFISPGGWYVNPTLRFNLEATLPVASADEAATLRQMMRVPSAFWIDNKAKIRGEGLGTLEGILKDAGSKPNPPLCVFIFCEPA